jgi:hypothetical protein
VVDAVRGRLADGRRHAEYVLLFRKPPTDNTSGYADVPVVKTKAEYTKGRWQMEAHGVWRSNGNRLLEPTDLVGLPWNAVFSDSAASR